MLRTDQIRRRVSPFIVQAYGKVHGFDFRYHRDGSRAHGLVLDGPWDRSPAPALAVDDYPAFREHFLEGVPWEKTARFRKTARTRDRAAQEKWLRRAAFWDALFHEMRENGYRRQEEVRSDLRLGNVSIEGSTLNEIQVVVARSGEVLRIEGGGNHRFLLANLLGIEEIPVVVNAWHARLNRSALAAPTWPKLRPAPGLAPVPGLQA